MTSPLVRDQASAWQVVHVGPLMFVPLVAGVVFLLLRGVVGVAALLSLIALAAFAVFYTAWEVPIGVGTGILVEQVWALRPSGRPAPRWSSISPAAPLSAPLS